MCHAPELRHWTDCSHFYKIAKDRFNRILQSKELVKELIGDNKISTRKRRGVLNFVGEISKLLFGTLDNDDAEYYNEQIKRFEENSEDMTSLMKQQLYIVKASLATLNDTVSDMEYSEKLVQKGLTKLKSYLEELTSETRTQLNTLTVKMTLEGHFTRVNSACNAIQRNLDLIIDSILNAQKGVLQPQIVNPHLIVETLMKSMSAFPKDTVAPFALNKDSTSLINRVCDVHIYIKKGILGYVITIPLVNRGTFRVFRLLPLPLSVENNKFVYIETGNCILYIDQTRQYYFTTNQDELVHCKTLEPQLFVCKQRRPLFSSHMQEMCAVKMLQLSLVYPRFVIHELCPLRTQYGLNWKRRMNGFILFLLGIVLRYYALIKSQ